MSSSSTVHQPTCHPLPTPEEEPQATTDLYCTLRSTAVSFRSYANSPTCSFLVKTWRLNYLRGHLVSQQNARTLKREVARELWCIFELLLTCSITLHGLRTSTFCPRENKTSQASQGPKLVGAQPRIYIPTIPHYSEAALQVRNDRASPKTVHFQCCPFSRSRFPRLSWHSTLY